MCWALRAWEWLGFTCPVTWGTQVVPAPLQSLGPAFPGPSLGPAPCSPVPLPTGTTLDIVEVESYDPYTDTWTPVSPALKYVSNFSAASCQGRLYLVGSSACKYNALALQCYNPVTGGEPSRHVGPRGERGVTCTVQQPLPD